MICMMCMKYWMAYELLIHCYGLLMNDLWMIWTGMNYCVLHYNEYVYELLNLNNHHTWRQMHETMRSASLQMKGRAIPGICSISLPLHLLWSLFHNFIIHILRSFIIIKKGEIVDSMPWFWDTKCCVSSLMILLSVKIILRINHL